MLKIVSIVGLVVALSFLSVPIVRAQDTDGITVHCVIVTPADPRFFSCDDQHATIQDAINHAEPGETVLVGAGTYAEQLVITKPLILEGAGSTLTSIKPTIVVANTTSLFSGAPIAAIVLVDGTTSVAVTDLTVDGSPAGLAFACSPGYVGIFYRASSGAIQDTHVTNIHHPAAPGCQAVLGIFVQSGNGGPGLNSSVAILQNVVDVYGKNGITANEPGTFVSVTNNLPKTVFRLVLERGDWCQETLFRATSISQQISWLAACSSSMPVAASGEPRAIRILRMNKTLAQEAWAPRPIRLSTNKQTNRDQNLFCTRGARC
ncbi:MAG: hypothetical protein E6H01_00240 [Bacillati bacterium ANGP1]|uniref:DUF1565 domain-containing protein n=1 Tax=Candidatus Segetimicrobium genomatis TaxID=2569760 RepID=A0A537LFU2_9BACT|nr:MAG: hypothetical protein E6H01_00240 [Terrabacteria group bacterium ANGP1]